MGTSSKLFTDRRWEEVMINMAKQRRFWIVKLREQNYCAVERTNVSGETKRGKELKYS